MNSSSNGIGVADEELREDSIDDLQIYTKFFVGLYEWASPISAIVPSV